LAQFGVEGEVFGFGGQRGGDFPVLFGHKSADFAFAFDDQAHGDRLHAPCAERVASPAQLAPQQRADLVADQPIQHAPRLLRVHAVKVNRARALQGALHRGWR
jgi:hypothetical protein